MTVRLYPVPGAFIDGVPSIEMDVEDAEAKRLLSFYPPAFSKDPQAAIQPEGKPNVTAKPSPKARRGKPTRTAEPPPQPPPAEEATKPEDPSAEDGSSDSET